MEGRIYLKVPVWSFLEEKEKYILLNFADNVLSFPPLLLRKVKGDAILLVRRRV